MKVMTTAGTRVPVVKRTRQGMILLCLFVLFGLVGVGVIHAHQIATPTGGQLAPAPGGSGGGDPGPTSIAASNGEIIIGTT